MKRFKKIGITDNVHESTWWESKQIGNMTFVFTPAQHWTGRAVLDRNTCLWGSWTVIGPTKRVFFAGDSGTNFKFSFFLSLKFDIS